VRKTKTAARMKPWVGWVYVDNIGQMSLHRYDNAAIDGTPFLLKSRVGRSPVRRVEVRELSPRPKKKKESR